MEDDGQFWAENGGDWSQDCGRKTVELKIYFDTELIILVDKNFIFLVGIAGYSVS